MGCRTSFCIGGGCVPTSTDPSAWVSAFGYTYNPSDPLASVYGDLIANAPNGLTAQLAWKALAEACMRTRAMLFCNQTPGDSGSTYSSSNNSNLLGVSVQLGQSGAALGEGVAGVAATSALGAATAGVGIVFSALLSAIQAHAQAEARQANALSSLGPYVTECIRKADIAVAQGAAPEDAISFLQQSFMAVKNSWAPLLKSCNAFCWYNAILDLIVQVSAQYYQLPTSLPELQQSNENNVIVPTAVETTQTSALAPGANSTSILAPSILSSGNTPLLIIAAVVIGAFIFGKGRNAN